MRISDSIPTSVRNAVLPAAIAFLLIACEAPEATPGSNVGRGTAAAPIALRPHRAYDGAPPVIPHAVGALSRDVCANCHLFGDAVAPDGTDTAPRTPHPELENCQQCHVEKVTDDVYTKNSFGGHVWETGARAHPEAPWLIPHPLTLHENCVGCHFGENVPLAVRTSHPERTNCVQCHVPAHEGWPGPRPGVTPAVPIR